MSMNIKESLKEFYAEIGEILKPYGFKVSSADQIAMKETNYGFNKIFFDMHKSHFSTYANTCDLRIRNDKIQEIKYMVDDFYKKYTSTIFTNVYVHSRNIGRMDLDFEQGGNLINFDQKESIEKWFQGFKNFMNEAGFVFFDSFHTVEDFDKWFNKPVLDGTYNFSKGMLWNDSLSGLVAAKLVNNPFYEDIYQIWREKLPLQDVSKTLIKLGKLYNFLKTYNP